MMTRKIKGNICDPNADRSLTDREKVHIVDMRFIDMETGEYGSPLYDEELFATIGGLIYVYRNTKNRQEFIYEVGIDGAKEWAEKHGVKLTDEELTKYGIPEKYFITPKTIACLQYLKHGKDRGSQIIEDAVMAMYNAEMEAEHGRR